MTKMHIKVCCRYKILIIYIMKCSKSFKIQLSTKASKYHTQSPKKMYQISTAGQSMIKWVYDNVYNVI